MKISVYYTPEYVTQDRMKRKNAAVIDVLRATSVIVTALQNGARGVAVFKTVEEAVNYKKNAGGRVLLGGERHAMKIQGFDFGNSPLEYTNEAVAEKFVALTTTNGTNAIEKSKDAANLYIMAFLNLEAVCKKLIEGEKDIVLVCSGTGGLYSMDDALCAGAAVSAILDKCSNYELDDGAFNAMDYYIKSGHNIKETIKNSAHYKRIVSLGFEEDACYCVQEDIFDIVPFYKNGLITI